MATCVVEEALLSPLRVTVEPQWRAWLLRVHGEVCGGLGGHLRVNGEKKGCVFQKNLSPLSFGGLDWPVG
jgi:hypothetical protein